VLNECDQYRSYIYNLFLIEILESIAENVEENLNLDPDISRDVDALPTNRKETSKGKKYC